MALNDTSVISNLINVGADAQSNLFYVTFLYTGTNIITDTSSTLAENRAKSWKFTDMLDHLTEAEDLRAFTMRTSNFNAPALKTQTINVPYQNVQYPLLSPSAPISKQLAFTFRVDENYNLYNELKNSLANVIDNNGILTEVDPENTEKTSYLQFKNPAYWAIKVDALKINDTYNSVYGGYFKPAATWKFYNCVVVDIPQMQFNYNSAKPLEITTSFIYSDYDFSTTRGVVTATL